MTFGEKLARLQAEHFETNYRLAKEIGVHPTTIANWKTGSRPQLAHRKRLADHYGIPLRELMEEGDHEEQDHEVQ